jgi:rhamnulokinase
VAAAPIFTMNTAYLSSGTWSLVGVESETPVTHAEAFEYNLTNEGGVDGRYRILKNIMGLWLIQRIKAENPSLIFSDITALAQQATPFEFVVNPNDEDFLNPSSMTAAIKNWFKVRNLPVPESLAQIVRCIYDSLALAYDDAIAQIATATKRPIEELRIVGGGIQDRFLNQLCADVCQIPVSTEPQEASALGNVINQFIALDIISCLEEGRKIIDLSSQVSEYQPNPIADLKQIKAQYQLVK